MNKKVAIVLVNYNGALFQRDCIESIKKMKYKNYDIIIVDNGSKDKSIDEIKEIYSEDVILIETGINNGIAKGNNIGIKFALENNYEYVLLLNNDTVVDEYMLSNMLKKANDKTLVTCKMYFYEPNNVIWCAGGKINWSKGTTSHIGENEEDSGKYDESRYVEYTPTCCLLIHRNIFNKVGLMDEKYFMYYDDTDFCVRCNNQGYKIWYEHSAKLWHKVSSSSGGAESKITIYYSNRNRLYFIDKFCKNKILPKVYFYITRVFRYIKYIKYNKSVYISKAIKDYYNNNMYIQNI